MALLAGLCSVNASAQLTSNESLAELLTEAAEADHVTLTEIGRSVEDHPIWAVRVVHHETSSQDACVVLLIGQQHGDEPAGTEALIDLIEDFAADADQVPVHADLWIVPRLNPDGADTEQRRNANDADLNRDHVLLAQPETRALHALAREIQPHLAVDCHEFRRDTGDYLEQGWTEWPLIMMDTANLALMPEAVYELGVELCDRPGPVMAEAGFNYQRYIVGSCPAPHVHGELRHSTLDPDDARNGLSAHGTVSFIIESGIYRQAEDPNANLPERVAAYRLLLSSLLDDPDALESARLTAEAARVEPMPALIPTNVVWANTQPRLTEVAVVEIETGLTRVITTPIMMHDRVVKTAVQTPAGYVIDPSAADRFAVLLDAHGLGYYRLEIETRLWAQAVRLDRLEDEFDPVYHRYAGRQVTTPDAPSQVDFPAGSLVVDLTALSPTDARRAALLLEPRQLFGLYQWAEFLALTRHDGRLPVARLIPGEHTPPSWSHTP